MSDKENKYLTLFKIFFKMGAFTFGGGYAMIPLIESEIVEKRKWIDNEDILDIFSICQSVPGVLAVNSSLFIGFKVAGVIGALISVFSVTLPSFIVITLIFFFLKDFMTYSLVEFAFLGIRVGVVLIIINAVIKLSKSNLNAFSITVMVASFILSSIVDINVMFILIGAAIISLVFHKMKKDYLFNKKDGK